MNTTDGGNQSSAITVIGGNVINKGEVTFGYDSAT